MPSLDQSRAHVIDVVLFPGSEDVAEIDLLAYPFVCHELGHNILFKYGDSFAAGCAAQLGAVVEDMQRQSIAIRGLAKQRAGETIAQLRAYWRPSADHKNWTHEIAVDIIALWLCGPAYLAAFQDVLEADGLDPHQLGQSHPTYEVRARALITGAVQLGWAYYTGSTQTLVDQWATDSAHRTNLHVACADPRLIDGVVSAAIATCRTLSLPLCTPETRVGIGARMAQGMLPDFGTDLLLAAWHKRQNSDEPAYNRWEEETVRAMLGTLTE